MRICLGQNSGIGCGAENPDGALTCARCGRSLADATHLLVRGDVVAGRYLIARAIGSGGFGKVFVAKDLQEGRRHVALKEALDSKEIEHFRSEFAVLRRLSHPHLPCYYDFVEEYGFGYLVMEYVPGQSLDEVLTANGGPLAEKRTLGYARQLCDALGYLHSQSPPLIHRDVKPANVRVMDDGTVKLVDFGLLKQGTDTTSPSRRGATLAYCPPEQLGAGGRHTGPRSDIYALGATLYHVLTGCGPPTATERIVATADPLVAPRKVNSHVSQRVSDAVLAAMSLHVETRPANVRRFRQRLMDTTGSDLLAWLRDWRKAPAPASAGGAPPSRRRSWKPVSTGALPSLLRSARKQPLFIWLFAGAALTAVTLFSLGWLLSTTSGDRDPARATPVATYMVPTAAPDSLRFRTEVPGVWVEPFSGITFVRVPAGEFIMGSTDAQAGAAQERCGTRLAGCTVESLAWELPQQVVYVADYWIGQDEVTNAQFRIFLEGGGYADPSLWARAGWQWRSVNGVTQPGCWDAASLSEPEQPVVCVSWYEAVAYARWLAARTGQPFRLPTEAEWEKAARGTDGRTYPWGEDLPGNLRANFCDARCTGGLRDAAADDGYELTAPVGSFPFGASSYGVQDVAGNVFEWTASELRIYPYSEADGRENAEGVAARALRGGSFYHSANDARCAARMGSSPETRSQVAGFRLVLSQP